MLGKLLINRDSEIIKYLIVGVLTTVVSLGSYFLLVHTLLDPTNALQLQLANILSWIAAVTFAYAANRIYVFESKSKDVLHEAFLFYAARLASLLADIAIMFVGVSILRFNNGIVKLLVQVIVLVMNYIFSKWIVFKRRT